jgi:hypothetical protein
MRIFSILAIASLTTISTLHAGSLSEKYASYGNLIVSKFQTAPFPHPDRANGHYYKTNFFSAAEHYSDSTVAMFIPKGFHPGKTIDFEVHFHGWGNNVAHALDHYKLIEQFAAAERNAILIVPQGPYNASDTFDGKLEDTNGFARFMAEAVNVLQTKAGLHHVKIGSIILSGHSGGYGVISSILVCGGMNDHIREVWLFDALYGRTEKFASWFSTDKAHRFIDIYTDHGGTKDETENLMADLKKKNIPFYFAEEPEATPAQLENNKMIFLHTTNTHDVVMQHNDTFKNFLETSLLSPIQLQTAKTPRQQ